jgi:mono/diheme cytochrome c family protein
MMRAHHSLPALVAVLAAASAFSACSTDPVHDDEVSALGPEAANIPQGQYHRAGQACVVCHGPEGPANTQFSIAGTVFFGPAVNSPPVGVGNVTVQLEDDSQSKFSVTTNCVGNFWVKPSDWSPAFPVLVSIAGNPEGTALQQTMQSHIGRDPSCGDCHGYATNLNYFETPGLIHLASTDDPKYMGDPSCAATPFPNTPIPFAAGGQ